MAKRRGKKPKRKLPKLWRTAKALAGSGSTFLKPQKNGWNLLGIRSDLCPTRETEITQKSDGDQCP